MERINIGIIGAGPAGLTLALALAKRKEIDFMVFEKSNDHLEAQTYDPSRSYTIDITGHGAKALSYVGAKSRFDKDLIKFKGVKLNFMNAVDPYDGYGWTGSRGDICRALQLELQERTGKRLINFNTEATVIDINEGVVETKDINGMMYQNKFDLIVAADGAGSSARNQIQKQDPQFKVVSYNNLNYSMMLSFDQNTDELDPSYLYLLSPAPVMAVAGAINGERGKLDPKWFCQIGFSGKKAFKDKTEAKNFLISSIPKASDTVLRYASDKSIENFASQTSISTGRAKECSSLCSGRLILLGDAGAPFPPIGQGVNHAMEMAMALDQSIERLIYIGQFQNHDDFINFCQTFSKKWKPQADAIRQIAFKGLDLRQFSPRLYGQVKMALMVILHKLFGGNAMFNAKKDNMSYTTALYHQQSVDKFIKKLTFAFAVILVFCIFWQSM